MKYYVEIQGHTTTRAQFVARCRAALRKTGLPCYDAWIDTLDCTEEMDMIAAGNRTEYYSKHHADEERPFDELCSCSSTSYQLYLNRKDENVFYNFIFEWFDGYGYFYCIDCMAVEQAAQRIS